MDYTFNVKEMEEKKLTRKETSKKSESEFSTGWQEYGGISPWERVMPLTIDFWPKYMLHVTCTINQEYNSKCLGLLVTPGSCQSQCTSLEKSSLMLERLGAGGEGSNRGWDGQRASLTWWTWIWANSERLRRTGKPGMLQSVGLQRVRHDLATKQ